MPAVDRFRVGLIGYGIGKTYAAVLRMAGLYYDALPPLDLVAIATASEESGRQAQRHFGFERRTTDFQQLLDSDDINTLVVAAPNHLHRDILVRALPSGKAILTDKPLARTLAEATEITQAAKAAGSDAEMIFQFRFCPAVMRACQMVREGRIGRIYNFRFYHFRPSYVDPEKPLRWNGTRQMSGGGVLPALAAHSLDLLIWMLGMPVRLATAMRTFVHDRPAKKGSLERLEVDTEDHAIVMMELSDGAIGVVEAGRLVRGVVNELGFMIVGSQGTLRWEAMNPNYLHYAGVEGLPAADGGWAAIPTVQKYSDASLPAGDVSVGMMRFYVANFADFLQRSAQNRPYDPNLAQGMRVQAVLEAALSSGRLNGAWEDVRQF